MLLNVWNFCFSCRVNKQGIFHGLGEFRWYLGLRFDLGVEISGFLFSG